MHTVDSLTAEAGTSVRRVATGRAGEARSHLLFVSYPDGSTSEHGGKVATRASHVVVGYSRAAREGDSEWYREERADTWGVLAICGRADLAVKRYNALLATWCTDGDAVELVEVVG